MQQLRRRRGSLGYGARLNHLKAGILAGFCLTALPAYAEPVTLAALGDSLTQGYGLPPDDGLVPQLQAWLSEHGHDVMVVNAGVSGDTTAGGLARIDWTLSPEIDGLIVALGGNDMLRGIDPAASRANLDGILVHASERELPVLLIGLTSPGNFGPDYKAAFEAIYPELSAEHGTLLVTDMLAPIREKPLADIGNWMQSDNIHPNADGVSLIVQAIGPSVEALIGRAAP